MSPSLRLPVTQHIFPIRLPFRWFSHAAIETHFIVKPQKPGGQVKEWKKLSSRELGISTSKISEPTKAVLKGLKKNGYEVYLVGGCVRDLILKRVPKDFDILTSAELREVIRTFPQSEIVGRRFPICHVHIGDSIVEVSSLSTSPRKYSWNGRFAFGRPIGCDGKDNFRWRNCMQRDFTINGLLFDPFARLIYDYIGGLEDIRKAKVRTIVPATTSFREDCARILRGIRIAARLGFCLARETDQSVRNLSASILRLDKARVLMELNYMFGYGSAEASIRLLWKYGLLEILLPHQAAYFVRSGFKRTHKGSNMLLALFSNLDKLLAPDRPCHSSLWIAIFAFHNAVSLHARDPSVVAAFSLAVHNGGDIVEAIAIARKISLACEQCFNELLAPQTLEESSLKKAVMDLASSVNRALSDMTDEDAVLKSMSKYPQAPRSNMVFIPLALYLRASQIFECVSKGKETGFWSKQGSRVDYGMLAVGSLQEVRHIFARVVFDTLYPLPLHSC